MPRNNYERKIPKRCNSCWEFLRGKDKCKITSEWTDPLKIADDPPTEKCKYECRTHGCGYKTFVCIVCGKNFTKGKTGKTAAKKRKTLPGQVVCARCVKKVLIKRQMEERRCQATSG